MTDPNEMPEVEEAEEQEEIEVEVPNEEIIEAIEDELSDEADDDVEAADDGQPEPEVEPEPEAKADDEIETDEAEPEPEESKEPEAETKPSDEFGALEKDAPEKTRERFETMKGRFDEVVQERDQIKADADQWKQTILETGTNPEQFGMALTYLQKVNSGKPEDLQAAYDIMSGELNAIGKLIGKPALDGNSPIEDHADLKARVEDGLLDEKDALEIIEARAAKKLQETQSQQATVESERKHKIDNAIKGIEQIGAAMKQRDPLYFNGKMKLLEPIITSIIQSAPNAPESWGTAIQAAYDRLPNIPDATVPSPKPATPESLRPTSASPANSTLEKEPGSAVEAIDMALSRGY